jgi:cation diffusion facilitator family transporter
MPETLSSKTIVWIELIADVLVAVVKLAAAFFTGSAAIAAEGVHSVVDVGSGGLMLYGYRRSQLGPDSRHPLGYGRELYFWSFVVALLFFTLGAGYSIFEGVRRILSPADIRLALVIYIVLAAEALFDGVSFVLALRAFSAAKGDLGYWEAITKSKDAPSFIVLAEDTAGLVGIAVAAAGTLLATSFNLPVADGVASVVVGLVLAIVGWVLVRESKGLLIGEQASSELSQSILALAESQDGVEGANGGSARTLRPIRSSSRSASNSPTNCARLRSRRRCGRWKRAFAQSTRRRSLCLSNPRVIPASGKLCLRAAATSRS